MRNTSFAITVPHSFSPISMFCTDSRPYIITLRFKRHKTFQINQSNFQITKNAFVQGL